MTKRIGSQNGRKKSHLDEIVQIQSSYFKYLVTVMSCDSVVVLDLPRLFTSFDQKSIVVLPDSRSSKMNTYFKSQ